MQNATAFVGKLGWGTVPHKARLPSSSLTILFHAVQHPDRVTS